METFFHGSTVLFDHFDLSHVTEGDGKVKFGYGVYVTEKCYGNLPDDLKSAMLMFNQKYM